MGSEPIVVAVGVPLEGADLERILAVDPRVRLTRADELLAGFATPILGERLERLQGELAAAEVLFATSRIRAEHLRGAQHLRWVHLTAAGVEGFGASGGLELGLTVTNSSGAGAGPIAEWVVGAILAFAKGFPQAFRQQQEHRWTRSNSVAVDGKTAGIVGLGAIGRQAARRLRPFGVRIIATRRSARPGESDPDCDVLLPLEGLPRLLEQSDFVVLCVPLTPETRHLVDAERLALMKPSALLVNIARGGVVDQPALVAALRAGALGGAALDVTDPEPLPADDPLWDLPNVLITPHTSGSFDGHWSKAADIFVRNLQHYILGEPLENVVTNERGY